MKDKSYFKIRKFFVFLCLGMSLLIACEDTFEKDISEQNVNLLAPKDTYRFMDSNINFWWEPIVGANEYNIQIVKLDAHDEPLQLVIDSFIVNNQFGINLFPGRFEWSIVACNSAYETNRSYKTFSIDSTLDISNSSIIMLSPIDNWVTNDAFLTFSWSPLYNADKYTLEIKTSDNNGNTVVYLSNLTDVSVDTALNEESMYSWTVYGDNTQSGTSSIKEWKSFLIDRTPPNTPLLIAPVNNDTIHQEDLVNEDKIRFEWSKLEDSGSVIQTYNLEIATDSLFGTIINSYSLTDTFYLWSNSEDNKLFWRVKGIDKAGNEGGFSINNCFYQD